MFEIEIRRISTHEPGRGVRGARLPDDGGRRAQASLATSASAAPSRASRAGLPAGPLRCICAWHRVPSGSRAISDRSSCSAPRATTRTRGSIAARSIDLAALARPSARSRERHVAGLYLASLLETENDDTTILINTDLHEGSKPGTHVQAADLRGDPAPDERAQRSLSPQEPAARDHRHAARASRSSTGSRYQQETAPDEDSRALYKSLEAPLPVREMPERVRSRPRSSGADRGAHREGPVRGHARRGSTTSSAPMPARPTTATSVLRHLARNCA